jgi:uncharacterized protein (DUF1501 family)
MLTRRQLLRQSVVLGAVGSVAPTFLWQARVAHDTGAGALASAPSDRTLIIIQMAGGNDGLNMVVPYADAAYLSARPTLHVDPASVLRLNDQVGLNPVMGSLKNVWDAKQLAIIEGVGYPNPNYSHFQSMAIWQTAAPKGEFSDGWLGRYFKHLSADAKVAFAGVDIGNALTPMLQSTGVTIPAFQNPDSYKLAFDPQDRQARLDAWVDLQTAARAGSKYLSLIGTVATAAYSSTQALTHAVNTYQPAVSYGKDPLSGSLQLLASIVVDQPGTKVGYATIGGYDTHTNERRTQDTLLTTLSDALGNFQEDIAAHGKAENVLLLTWTEFGRRVKENGNQGTDHGDGGTLLVMGARVKGGIYGDLPDLDKPDGNGSVQWTTDFRSVYASLLEGWLGVESSPILGGRFQPIPFVAA